MGSQKALGWGALVFIILQKYNYTSHLIIDNFYWSRFIMKISYKYRAIGGYTSCKKDNVLTVAMCFLFLFLKNE